MRRRIIDEPKVTLGQDVWWRNRDRVFLLIDHMDDRYRRNCANWLMDRSAAILIPHWRAIEIRKELLGPYDVDIDYKDEQPKSLWDTYRDRMDRGEHIDAMKAAPLYQRLAASL